MIRKVLDYWDRYDRVEKKVILELAAMLSVLMCAGVILWIIILRCLIK